MYVISHLGKFILRNIDAICYIGLVFKLVIKTSMGVICHLDAATPVKSSTK